jgi:IS605 OrfB family transposase
MTTDDEGFLTLSISVRVSPEPVVIKLLHRYRYALNYAINKIIDNNLRTLKQIHNFLYKDLVERFNLPSRIAVDCYRDALANVKAWRNNPKRGKRPAVKKLSVLLHPGSGYRIKDGYVEIIGGLRLRVIGWDRRYDEYKNREARLVYKRNKLFLWISKKIPKPKKYSPIDVIGVDINEQKIVYGDEVINIEKDTAINKAYKYIRLAEDLQRKYSSSRYLVWKRRRGILRRIRSYHEKAKNILNDWTRKISLEIVRLAKELRYAISREDLTNLIRSLRELPKDHKTKLIIMGYSRIERWIDWQAEKHGVPYVKVDPNGTSSECPICDYKGLEEVGYRRLRCPRCGFEADRDVIGKLNVRKKGLRKLGIKFSGGSLATPTAPQMTDVAPNR